MEQIIVNGLSVEQLLKKIGELVDLKLNRINPPVPSTQSEFLSRAQVSSLLKISLPTLHDWTKLGWLNSYKIGNRVLYKLEEVKGALEKASTNKHKEFKRDLEANLKAGNRSKTKF